MFGIPLSLKSSQCQAFSLRLKIWHFHHDQSFSTSLFQAIPLSLLNTSLELSTFDCNCHLSWLKITNTPLAAHGPLANTNHCHQRALQQRRGAGGASWSPDIFILQHSESTGCSTCQEWSKQSFDQLISELSCMDAHTKDDRISLESLFDQHNRNSTE